MRVLSSAYGSRGDVEPIVGLAVRLRALGAEVRVCAPPDFAESLALVGAPLVSMAANLPRRAAELVVAQFDTVAVAAEVCDALVATGVMPAGVWR